MSRHTHVVRTDDVGGLGRPRSLGGGCMILCDINPCGPVSSDDEYVLLGPIPLSVVKDYQRIFVSASVAGIHVEVSE